MSEANPIEQVTLDRLLADPAASFALKVVIDAWAERDLVNAANDAWLLFVTFARAADRRLSVAS